MSAISNSHEQARMERHSANETRARRLGYLIAVAGTALAVIAKLLFMGLLGQDAPMLILVLPLVTAAWYGGLYPALLATVLCTLASNFLIFERANSFIVVDEADQIRLVLLLGIGVLIALAGQAKRRAEGGLRESAALHENLSTRLKLLLQTTSHLIETLDTKNLLSSLLDLSSEMVSADAFCVWRFDGQSSWRVVSSKGLSDAFVQDSLPTKSNWLDLSKRPIIVQPHQLEKGESPVPQEHYERYEREGIRSLMILPLRISGQPSGTLVFYCRTPHTFTDLEIESALGLSNIAAAALSRAELYEAQSELRRDAEDAAVRESLLAATGAILSESLGYEETLSNVARAAVPQFADWCWVDLLDDSGSLRRLAVAHANPEKVELARQLHERYPLAARPRVGVLHVIKTGKPEMMKRIPDAVLVEHAHDETHLEILRSMGFTSYICAPLVANGAVCGAVTFISAESGRIFEKRDLSVATEITRRASQAIDNARLYRDLQQSEERYRAIVESQTEMVCRFRLDGTILFVNAAYARALGTSPEALFQRNFWEFIDPEDHTKVERLLACLTPDEPEVRIENRFETNEGTRWTLWNNRGLAFDLRGRATEVQSSGVDITDRKRAEEALKEADRRKDEFLATLAHELRNPLAPIRTGLELLDRVRGNPEIFEETRSMMERQTQQLIALVNDLLDVSRITRGKFELRKCQVKLSDIIESALEMSRHFIDEAGHTLTVYLPEQPLWLHGDPHRLAQVLCNLLSNAGKYTPARGKILLSAHNQGDAIIISVKDNGIGIPANLQQRIFEMFAQVESPIDRSQPGLGIGLTLVKSLVEMHNGSIEVRSDGTGQGSEFRIRLPAIRVEAVDPGKPVKARFPVPAQCRRVLIVDDNKPAAEMLSVLVRMLGNEAHTAADGQEAIRLAADLRPDLVLMDLGMPTMNGFEAARHIRSQPWGKDLLLVALTGWGQREDKQKTKAAGFDHHLVKPAEPDMLRALLEEVSMRHREHSPAG